MQPLEEIPAIHILGDKHHTVILNCHPNKRNQVGAVKCPHELDFLQELRLVL